MLPSKILVLVGLKVNTYKNENNRKHRIHIYTHTIGQAFVSYLYKKSIRSKQINIIRTYLCTRGRTKILFVSCGVEREGAQGGRN